MTWTLAVLSQTLHSLVYKSHVLLVDVETQQAQSSGGAATDAVQKLEGLADQVVVVLVVLVAQEVLRRNKDSEKPAQEIPLVSAIKLLVRIWETRSSVALTHNTQRSKNEIFLGEIRV